MCNKTKPKNEFYPSKQTRDGLFSYCKPCKIEANKRSDNKRLSENRVRFLNQRKNWHLKNVFGITLEEYNTLSDKQNGVCAICLDKDKDRMLAVDHCHNSNRIRGLLCGRCNRAIGQLKDNTESMKRAIAYLSAEV